MLELIEDKNKNEGDQLTERLLRLKKVFTFYIDRIVFVNKFITIERFKALYYSFGISPER